MFDMESAKVDCYVISAKKTLAKMAWDLNNCYREYFLETTLIFTIHFCCEKYMIKTIINFEIFYLRYLEYGVSFKFPLANG